MTNTLDILELLHGYYQSSREIQLLNTYRGMPIANPAQVLSVSDQNVLVSVHQNQAVCLEPQRRTYINLDLPLTIKAVVCAGNVDTRIYNLTDINIAENEIGNREIIRVNPKIPLPVVLTKKGSSNRKIIAELIDLSVVGIGVYGLSISLAEIQGFGAGSKVNVRLILPENGQERMASQELEVAGSVVNIIPRHQEERIRLGIKITPDAETRSTITSYVSKRQVEIISEIRMLYQTLIQLSRK